MMMPWHRRRVFPIYARFVLVSTSRSLRGRRKACKSFNRPIAGFQLDVGVRPACDVLGRAMIASADTDEIHLPPDALHEHVSDGPILELRNDGATVVYVVVDVHTLVVDDAQQIKGVVDIDTICNGKI